MTVPRSIKQVHRDNTPVTTFVEYYRVTMFVPHLDNFISMISDSLLKYKTLLKSFSLLFPVKDKIRYGIPDTFENDKIFSTKIFTTIIIFFSISSNRRT